MKEHPPKGARQSIKMHIFAGLFVLFGLLGALCLWAATTKLSGAVTASATLVVDTNVKKVQHPAGGVVKELRVRNGDQVAQGDILLLLDDTVIRANLAIVLKSLAENSLRQARLEAERDGMETIAFPADLPQPDGASLAKLYEGERKLFEFRRASRLGQKAQLKERIAQIQEEARSLSGQVVSKTREIELITEELKAVRTLWEKKLTPISRATALEREAVRLEGERNQLRAAAAQAKGKITETELQIIQIDQDLRTEVAKELREIQAKSAEFVERRVAAEDQLSRVEIRAPRDGRVHQLEIHTVGGVISSGEVIMLIVPGNDALIIEARIPPDQVDRITPGQRASLRFASANQQTTPEVPGSLLFVSPDIAEDARTGSTHYLARILPDAEQLSHVGIKLVPGMPVEVFLETEARTVISYLAKPLTDQMARAFRER